jgi:transcriptional regulator with XRE-family HTH domain
VPVVRHAFIKKLGVRVRELRAAAGYSQEAFADAAEIDRSYMSAIERGTRNFGMLTLLKLAKALKTSVSRLTDIP